MTKWHVRDLYILQIQKMMKTNTDTKILFTDLDGTLLTSDKKISGEDLCSIRAMINAGHKFVVATGRPLYSALKLCREYDFLHPGFYIVASNGGIIYDCTSEKILHKCTVPINLVSALFERAHAAGIHIQTYSDDHVIAMRETEEIKYYSSRIKMPYKIVNDISSDLLCEPPKVIIISLKDRTRLENFRDSVCDITAGQLNTVFSSQELLEFLPPSSTKGNALYKLCELFDIPISNSIACGDEENDISMIDAAGIGVVMGNGTDNTKSHADYITLRSNDENGISEVINKFILAK